MDLANPGLGDYKVINTALRDADTAKLSVLDSQIRLTTHALEYLPNYQGLTFRGVKDLDFTPYKPGNVVTLKSFTSTSVVGSVAAGG